MRLNEFEKLRGERVLDALREVALLAPLVEHGSVRSVYFTDPNGIALEVSWRVLDATGRPADYEDRRFFADTKPVPALQELQANGDLAHVSHTHVAQSENPIAPGEDK